MVMTKNRFFVFMNEHSYNKPVSLDKNSVLLVVAVKKRKLNTNSVLFLYIVSSKSGQLGWIRVLFSDLDRSFSVVAPT